jgi:hypothetical protein
MTYELEIGREISIVKLDDCSEHDKQNDKEGIEDVASDNEELNSMIINEYDTDMAIQKGPDGTDKGPNDDQDNFIPSPRTISFKSFRYYLSRTQSSIFTLFLALGCFD